MNINEFTDEDLIQDEIVLDGNVLENIPLEEAPIEPEGPEGLLDPKFQVYVPKATTYQPGIAKYDSKDFLVDPNGKVSLIVDLNDVKNKTNNALENSQTALEKSTQAVDTADIAKTIAEDALEQVIIGEGTKIYEDGVLQSSINVDKDIQEQFNDIDELIPAQASSENQLADKEFVNSSIATNTANFIGTFADVPTLLAYSGTITNNDYAFVVNSERDFASTTEMNAYNKGLLTNFDYAWIPNGSNYDLYRFDIIEQTWVLKVTNTAKADVTLNTAYNRYKAVIVGNTVSWVFEYTLNNSSFTADQWAAINSGITASGVAQIADIQNKMNKTNPTGTGSFSLNRKANTTIGTNSTAEGYDTTASGYYSHAEGQLTRAIGTASHAEGMALIGSDTYGAIGDYSHTEGNGATASGLSAHAEGEDTVASGDVSHAEGGGTTATNDYCHAEGEDTTASGIAAHAEGYETIASGSYAHAEGLVSIASGAHSHTEGDSTAASGENAHAEGFLTLTTGHSAHAEGRMTVASGSHSHAEGYNTKATRRSQHVFGEYNIEDANGDGPTKKGEYIEIVGNGTADNQRSNARTLKWNGDEWLAGNLTFASGKTVKVPTPTTNEDAVPKSYVDNAYSCVRIHGGNVSGNYTIQDLSQYRILALMVKNVSEEWNVSYFDSDFMLGELSVGYPTKLYCLNRNSSVSINLIDTTHISVTIDGDAVWMYLCGYSRK